MTVRALPARAAVIPVGAPGSGKSTVLERAARELGDPGFRFGPDDVRRIAFGTVAYQGAGQWVHAAARAVFAARLAARRAAAVDATNSTARERRLLVELAHRYRSPLVAVVFRVPLEVVLARNASRPDPDTVVPEEIVERMHRRVQAVTPEMLRHEGFDEVVEWSDDDPQELIVGAPEGVDVTRSGLRR